jgi:hypothetical protein
LKQAGILFSVFIVLNACGPDKDAIINQKVADKVKAFRDKKSIECRNMLLSEAERIVDSLLLAEAKMELGDSLARLRPAKPLRPAPVPPIDSLSVEPIFKAASSTGGKK